MKNSAVCSSTQFLLTSIKLGDVVALFFTVKLPDFALDPEVARLAEVSVRCQFKAGPTSRFTK
jgi:hypothetical protein